MEGIKLAFPSLFVLQYKKGFKKKKKTPASDALLPSGIRYHQLNVVRHPGVTSVAATSVRMVVCHGASDTWFRNMKDYAHSVGLL